MKLCASCHTLYGDEFEYCPRDETPLEPAPRETLAMYDPLRGILLDGRYRLLAPVGSGTLGDVYSAMFESMEKPVAVKILREHYARKPGWSEKFLQLAQAQAQVEHRHLAAVTDFGSTPDGRPFFVMEWISGEHLGECVRRRGPLPATEAADIVRQVASALAAAHARGIVHQNLKPSNVRLQADGDGRRKAVVTDLGLFSPAGGPDTVLGRELQLYGNPRYMAPEQIRGMPPSPAMDVYQLGLLAYTLLAGEPPFSGASFHELAAAQLHQAPKPLPSGVPRRLRELVLRMLEKDPSRRPADMDEVIRSLDLAANRQDRSGFLRAAGILAVAAAMLLVWSLWKRHKDASENVAHEPAAVKKGGSPKKGEENPASPHGTAAGERVRILVDSVPPGARISIGDRIQQAPAWFELPRSEEPVAGRAEVPGRPPLEFRLVPRRTGQVFIHLDSVQPPAPGRTSPGKMPLEPELLDPFSGK